MPSEPIGLKRPAGVVSADLMVAKILTRETQELNKSISRKIKSGLARSKVRVERLPPEARSDALKKSTYLRWE